MSRTLWSNRSNLRHSSKYSQYRIRWRSNPMLFGASPLTADCYRKQPWMTKLMKLIFREKIMLRTWAKTIINLKLESGICSSHYNCHLIDRWCKAGPLPSGFNMICYIKLLPPHSISSPLCKPPPRGAASQPSTMQFSGMRVWRLST